MRRNCVFFHAHPGDESLLTAGTMARLAAEGHRVVLVVATLGRAGDKPAGLDTAARALGCARVVLLGYENSGPDGVTAGCFAAADTEMAAFELAQVLRQEDADLLVTSDPTVGCGQYDHVQVHRVGTRAAELAGTPVVLEATAGPALSLRALVDCTRLAGLVPRPYVPEHLITHRVRVGPYGAARRAALAAHRADGTLLPRRQRGTEYFVRRGLPAGTVLCHPLEYWPTVVRPSV